MNRNVPNILTVSRLFFAFVIMLLLIAPFPFTKTAALLLFVLAGFTDYLDGYLARKLNLVTAFGKLMDPLTDKVMVCAVFISFVEIQFRHQGTFLHGGSMLSPGMSLVPLVPAWIVVVIISREFLVTGLRLLAAGRGLVISAGQWGKHKTVWQIIAAVLLMLGLSIRSDFLRGADPAMLADFDFAFMYIAHSLALAVAAITVASGVMYFLQHRELISRR